MNKPRLIDANKLIEDIKYWQQDIHDNECDAKGHDFVFDIIYDSVNDQPTAYDIDKVIKELIDNTQECTDRTTYETHSFVPLFDAIKIVRGGQNE